MIRNRRSVNHQSDTSRPGWPASRAAGAAGVPVLPCLCLLSLILVAGGCSSTGTDEKQFYILNAARQGEPIESPIDASLEVHRFSVDAAFATKGLVYRTGEFQYETDAYRQFLIGPGIMITERTRDWLADSHLFDRVLPVGSRMAPNYTLEGNVTALYGDFPKDSTGTAVMEIRFFLLDNARGQETVAFSQTYRAETPVSDRTVEVYIWALSECLADILTRLEGDLHKTMADRAQAGEQGRQEGRRERR